MNIQKHNGIFFYPVTSPEEWQQLLAKPDKHWRLGYSAKALAYCWQEAGDFPSEVKKVFRDSGIPVLKDVKMLIGFPEHKVSLPRREEGFAERHLHFS